MYVALEIVFYVFYVIFCMILLIGLMFLRRQIYRRVVLLLFMLLHHVFFHQRLLLLRISRQFFFRLHRIHVLVEVLLVLKWIACLLLMAKFSFQNVTLTFCQVDNTVWIVFDKRGFSAHERGLDQLGILGLGYGFKAETLFGDDFRFLGWEGSFCNLWKFFIGRIEFVWEILVKRWRIGYS